jgi:hypothetical protein
MIRVITPPFRRSRKIVGRGTPLAAGENLTRLRTSTNQTVCAIAAFVGCSPHALGTQATVTRIRVRVECTDCGVVRVGFSDVTLRHCLDDELWSYCFRCPSCGLANACHSPSGAVATLVAVGATVQYWHLPTELFETHADGPPFTLDDVLDFHLLLDRLDGLTPISSRTESGNSPEPRCG